MQKQKSPIGQNMEVRDSEPSCETVPTKAVICKPSSDEPKDSKKFKITIQDIVVVMEMIRVIIEIVQLL